MDITFDCKKCSEHVAVEEARAGTSMKCPKCRENITVPPPPRVSLLINEALRKAVQEVLAGDLSERQAMEQLSSLCLKLNYPCGDEQIELAIDTNTKLDGGYARAVSDNDPDVVDAFPAWELYRGGIRKEPRDWDERWTKSAKASGDDGALQVLSKTGRMVALKSSGIWKSLGSSKLWDDALDVNYPPFYFNSGMIGIDNILREDCIALGLLEKRCQEVKSQQGLQSPRFIPIEDERMSEWLENQPQKCAHCGETKSGKLVCEWCDDCDEAICPECVTKGCPNAN